MANIRESKKNGKTLTYRFTVCLERDIQGKQIRRYTTWTPPVGLAPFRAKKAAERAANAWEQEVRAEYQKEKEAAAIGQSYALPPEKRKDDFVSFVNDTWFALYICNGDRKKTTTVYYADIARYITAYFKGAILQEISPIHIQHYLQYLQKEREKRTGKPLSSKYLHHHYGTLKNIFGYAERNDLITKNPMSRVDAPKMVKKPVDALTPEQAKVFFERLSDCALDFHCMLHLLITTGIRRGECIGLKWKDIDEKNSVLRIERGVAYTSKRSLKERKQLKYPRKDFVWEFAFSEAVKNAKYDPSDHSVKMIIQDVNVMNEVRYYIEQKGWYDECSLNRKLLKIPLDCFLDITLHDSTLDDVLADETKKKIANLKNSESSVHKFIENFTEEGLKAFLMSASKEVLSEVISLLPFGGIAKVAFNTLAKVIEKS